MSTRGSIANKGVKRALSPRRSYDEMRSRFRRRLAVEKREGVNLLRWEIGHLAEEKMMQVSVGKLLLEAGLLEEYRKLQGEISRLNDEYEKKSNELMALENEAAKMEMELKEEDESGTNISRNPVESVSSKTKELVVKLMQNIVEEPSGDDISVSEDEESYSDEAGQDDNASIGNEDIDSTPEGKSEWLQLARQASSMTASLHQHLKDLVKWEVDAEIGGVKSVRMTRMAGHRLIICKQMEELQKASLDWLDKATSHNVQNPLVLLNGPRGSQVSSMLEIFKREAITRGVKMIICELHAARTVEMYLLKGGAYFGYTLTLKGFDPNNIEEFVLLRERNPNDIWYLVQSVQEMNPVQLPFTLGVPTFLAVETNSKQTLEKLEKTATKNFAMLKRSMPQWSPETNRSVSQLLDSSKNVVNKKPTQLSNGRKISSKSHGFTILSPITYKRLKGTKLKSGQRAFECNYCRKICTQRSNIVAHIRTHTGEKPFECVKCRKAFSQKSNLKRHIRAHGYKYEDLYRT